MPRSKKPSTLPSDDQVRELEGNEGNDDLTDDGRKATESERVGAMAPDADPDGEAEDHRARRPRHRSRR
jgi:hypothetical protein